MYVDKRLAGIQAVQTLSRLNRAHPGKDTTYVLDFVNDTEDVLKAFKTYYATAELANVSDPDLVYNLRAKLDAAGHYDDFEVDRVVAVELKPNAKQSELAAAVEPVVDRLQKRYKAAQEALKTATEQKNKPAMEAARERAGRLAAVPARHGGVSASLHVPVANLRLRQHGPREAFDLLQASAPPARVWPRARGNRPFQGGADPPQPEKSGQAPMPLAAGENPTLEPITEAGGGSVQEKQKARLTEIIERVNDLFEGDLTDQDKLVYVNNVIKGKLLESETLKQQAANNTKEQFANSPDLKTELMNAIMEALEAHTAMSTQALGSEAVRSGIKDVLLGPAELYESLREQAGGNEVRP